MNRDALLHVLAAVAISSIFVFATTPWLYMAVANTLFWIGREWAQSPTKKLRDWSRRKNQEWSWPTVAGAIASYATHLIIT